MEEFEKVKKYLKQDMITLFVLEILVIVLSLFTNLVQYKYYTVGIICCLAFAIVLFFGFLYAKNGEKIAGTIGIVVGVLMMLTIINNEGIDFLCGVIVFVHSIKYNKYFIENQ